MNRRLASLVLLLLLGAFAGVVGGESINFRVAGHAATTEGVRRDGEILVYLTPLLSQLGVTAKYDPADESLTLTQPGRPVLRAKAGSAEVLVGGEKRVLAQQPVIEEGKAFFPLYSLARLLGLYVRKEGSGLVVVNPAVTRVEVTRAGGPPAPGIAPTTNTTAPPGETGATKPSGAAKAPTVVKAEIAPGANRPQAGGAAAPAPGVAIKLVIEAGAPVEFAVKRLDDPFRVYVDLKHASLIGGSGERYTGAGDLLSVRASQFSYNPDVVRVVAEFASPVPYQVQTSSPGSRIEIAFNAATRTGVKLLKIDVKDLSPSVSRVNLMCDGFAAYQQSVLRSPNRVVVDLADTDASGVVSPKLGEHRFLSSVRAANQGDRAGTARVVVELRQMTALTVGRVSAREIAIDLVTAPLGRRVVVVDPGHGGKDPGAQYGDSLEKDLVLDIAKRLHARLVTDKVTALLTRSDDTFVSLSDRCRFADEAGADLFLSVHLNAAPRPNQASGTETYYYTDDSLPFAIAVHEHLTSALKLKDGGVRKRLLYVVHHTKMPAVLTETCYLNNDAEHKLATSPGFRQRAADAMFAAIRTYVEGPEASRPPRPDPGPPSKQAPPANTQVSTVTSKKEVD
jgi:N-acetylmuramoyl-L-alanine amidase